jgi:hypothetical protein
MAKRELKRIIMTGTPAILGHTISTLVRFDTGFLDSPAS